MNITDIIAVSGMPGLYKLVNSRSNGIMVEDIDSGKTSFCSMRKHQFTPMETVAIYTNMDTVEIKQVFQTMLDQLDKNPPVDPNGPKDEVAQYFESILPDYDRDRVYINDMKKVIKWFNYLNERDLLTTEEENKD